jgi:hypothetical protein
MDITALLIAAGFFVLSIGLVRLCERLQEGRNSS